jgi:hypothetical protein
VTGVRVTLTLTRRQATAVLGAELSVGHGVHRSAELIEAERRLMAAVQQALEDHTPRRRQTEPGA